MSEGGAKLVWPPTKEDLQRLYLVERLSAAKIARVYGLKYASEKTAESTVLYHLNRNGIVRRDKAEHIKKIIEEMVEEWINRYQEGESLKQIAGASVDPVSVWNHLRKKGVKLRDKVEAQIEAVTKHQKTSFHGNLIEKAYIIGLRVGDLNAVRHGRAIRARVSTTHPAMMELFTGIFADYGYVHKYPKKTPLTEWEWSLECDLDSSFEFLLDPAAEFRWIFESGAFFIAFLAGFFDADGSVYYHRKRARGGFEF
ncbi:MAG: hypothetical protein HY297_03855, partial [Thaumarchaeota archaeon]|nr:hypothetical protein [Nitrososphaerota archaeon]